MTRRVLLLAALTLALLPGVARAQEPSPYQQDPLGPMTDVTAKWGSYQPAKTFCIRPDVNHYTPGGTGATATGRDRACRRSGFPKRAKGLVKSRILTPSLCEGCRRLFIDYSKIPAENAPPYYYAYGHVYYHLQSINPTYTVNPIAHSPNTKNFTNDKVVAPDASPQEQVTTAIELHTLSYVSQTEHFVHNAAQGPYYIGPWYVSRTGKRIRGVYLDLDVANATELPDPALNAIAYMAGFNSGQTCSSEDDILYVGCADWGGGSATTVDPFAG